LDDDNIFASFPPKILNKLHNQKHKPGLYVVATPIGNIFDISLRALHILEQCKYIFAEDTRQSGKILRFYGLQSRLIPCHEHNEITATTMIDSGDTYALISDAGTPLISDPGYRLINWCIQNAIDVFAVPGACSAICALSIAGLPSDKFLFVGFLERTENQKIAQLKALQEQPATMIFFESPMRLISTLQVMREIWGDRYGCVCRELTKFFEETKRGTVAELYDYFLQKKPVGEFVILIAGHRGSSTTANNADEAEIRLYLQNALQISGKDAIRTTSEKFGIAKNVVYRLALMIKKDSSGEQE
jgi:16S rRNA (cytidine1402-2'-O)-methyltransferase